MLPGDGVQQLSLAPSSLWLLAGLGPAGRRTELSAGMGKSETNGRRGGRGRCSHGHSTHAGEGQCCCVMLCWCCMNKSFMSSAGCFR